MIEEYQNLADNLPRRWAFYRTANFEELLAMAYILRLEKQFYGMVQGQGRMLDIRECNNPMQTYNYEKRKHIGAREETHSFVEVINLYGPIEDLEVFCHLVQELQMARKLPFKTVFERSIVTQQVEIGADYETYDEAFRRNLQNAEKLLAKEAGNFGSNRKAPAPVMYGHLPTHKGRILADEYVKSEEHLTAYCYKEGHKSLTFGISAMNRSNIDTKEHLKRIITEELTPTVYGFKWTVTPGKDEKFEDVIDATFKLIAEEFHCN